MNFAIYVVFLMWDSTLWVVHTSIRQGWYFLHLPGYACAIRLQYIMMFILQHFINTHPHKNTLPSRSILLHTYKWTLLMVLIRKDIEKFQRFTNDKQIGWSFNSWLYDIQQSIFHMTTYLFKHHVRVTNILNVCIYAY